MVLDNLSIFRQSFDMSKSVWNPLLIDFNGKSTSQFEWHKKKGVTSLLDTNSTLNLPISQRGPEKFIFSKDLYTDLGCLLKNLHQNPCPKNALKSTSNLCLYLHLKSMQKGVQFRCGFPVKSVSDFPASKIHCVNIPFYSLCLMFLLPAKFTL